MTKGFILKEAEMINYLRKNAVKSLKAYYNYRFKVGVDVVNKADRIKK